MVRTCTGDVCVRSSRREPSALRREIERVVHFPRRMAFREIQFGEVVIVGLDIGTFGDGKAHVGEDSGQFVGHLADRMHATGFGRRLAHRQGDVDGFGVETGIERGAASASLRVAIAAVTRSFNPLIAGPCTLRSSGVMVPRVLSSADTEPLLPSAATRTASKPLRPWPQAMAAEEFLFSSCAMSGHGSIGTKRRALWHCTPSDASIAEILSFGMTKPRPTSFSYSETNSYYPNWAHGMSPRTRPQKRDYYEAGNAALAFSTIA